MLWCFVCTCSAGPSSPQPDMSTPRVPYATLAAAAPKPKVNLVLDPLAYRSSSQGPIMPKELIPTTKDDMDEIDHVIERATSTHGWKPVIPQYSKQPHWAWMQWEGTIVERLWKLAVEELPAACAGGLLRSRAAPPAATGR